MKQKGEGELVEMVEKVFRDKDVMKPRVHGNGFIQIDLDERRRLHVWGHPEIPRQKTWHPIHDHVFSFTSTVIVGRVVNVVYQPIERPHGDGRYEMLQALPPVKDGSQDTKLAPAPVHDPAHGKRFDLAVLRTDVVHADETYAMRRFEFHETIPVEPTITVMEKSGPTLAERPSGHRPYVAVPHGVEPDNEFDRDEHPRELLMQIFREVWEMRK